MKKFMKTIVVLAILAGVAYAAWKVFLSYAPKDKARVVFKTEDVQKTDVIRSISATGTVEPEELVNVGAQVNGKVMSFGKDIAGHTVDFSSKVKAGMVMAQIDDVPYKAELQEAEATKERAVASIQSAEAGIKQAEARSILAANNWTRAQTLYKEKSMTKSDYDSYESEYYTSQAEIAVAKASLAEAKASLSSAEASLVKAKRNLDYCVITSPIDGVVIDRRVSIGQTVVSNQTASSIFLVAKDFSKMQVWVSVNEADIGSIKPGMPVIFSCDAFPGVEFRGTVFRLRLNATLSSNVVTYIVEVNTNNESGKLQPYLTANVKFVRDERRGVLAVPASALRYSPSPDLIDPAVLPPAKEITADEAVLWIEKTEGLLTPVIVKVGLNNGTIAEIITSELKEDDKIVTGIDTASVSASIGTGSDASGEVKNPFMPSMPKFSGRGSAGARERASQRASGGAQPGGQPPARRQ